MDKKFTSDEVPLSQLLNQAQSGALQLPDFQRGWVWDDNGIKSLLASISLSYPIGAVMTLATGNPDVKFRPRALEGVTIPGDLEPEWLLLDGQQRMTSLYLVLKSGKPVPTRDARGREFERNYFIDIAAALDSNIDREDAIVSVPPNGVVATFGKEVILDVSTRDKEVESELFPLGIVLDYSETMAWQLAYLSDGPGESSDRLDVWKRFNESIVNSYVQYQVPTIQLIKATPKEAVCQVFEKVNTGGVSLTVFELLTATYAADDYNLRDDWSEREKRFAAHAVLDRLEATDFLQVVALLATLKQRETALATNPDLSKAPAVGCKRRDILRLSLADYKQWAEPATKAIERMVPFLHSERIFAGRDVPYATQLVPLAAILACLGDVGESFGAREMLRQWYWCGVFGEMYGGSVETRYGYDVQDVPAWVVGSTAEPRTVRDAQFQAERLLSLRSRQSAAYKGLYALQMKRGGRDFRTGNTIDIHAYSDDAIEIHHIFPQAWCRSNGVATDLADSVVNKTAIDAQTNRRIGGSAPSSYLKDIEKHEHIAGADLDAIVRSHDIDPTTLRTDDFSGFFAKRFERLLKQIEDATGKPVNRAADGTDNPFAATATVDAESAIRALVEGGESKVVEFKTTARLNVHTGDKDPAIEWAALKSIAGFANAYGGTLVVGIADDGTIKGIEGDFPHVQNTNYDGWELWLTGAVSDRMGKVVAADLDIAHCTMDGVTVARIDIGPSAKPVFAKKDNKLVFFVRTNNSTQELSGPELLDYEKSRWP